MRDLTQKSGEGSGVSGTVGYIDKPYAYHKPSDDGHARITKLREAYSALQRTLAEVCPPSRQLSVAVTELETSAMWAIKSVVFNDPNSETEDTNVRS